MWTKEEAIREMKDGGFNFHPVWKNIPDWIKELDIDAIRKDAGIKVSKEKAPADKCEPASSEE